MRACALALDELPNLGGYEANIVLVNRRDKDAHIFVGASNPRVLSEAISDLIACPDQAGIVNCDGVNFEL